MPSEMKRLSSKPSPSMSAGSQRWVSNALLGEIST